MKHFIIGIALALALALVMGLVAFAEPATEPVPVITEDAATESAATEDASAAQNADDSAALQEAMAAYRAAKQSERVDNLTEELNGYVAAGKLTQEQADLIMKYYKDRQAMRNGTCPSCGYQFQNGRGGQMDGNGFGRGGRGGRGGKGGRMNGGFGGFGGMMPGTPEGMSAQGDVQAMPQMAGSEGI